MLRFTTVFFDFDGTLIDSGPSIMHAIRKTMQDMGLPDWTEQQMRAMIGPPLTEGFGSILGLQGDALIEAVALYRRHYRELSAQTALQPYPGIAQMLIACKRAGIQTGVATCKREEFARRQAQEIGIASHLDFIAGASFEEDRTEKEDVLRYAMKCMHAFPEQTAMVGDRKYDLLAANAIDGVAGIGVLYGYGDEDELRACRPLALVRTPLELAEFLTGGAARA